MRETKWFEIDDGEIRSIERAVTKKEAFSKSISKWYLLTKPGNHISNGNEIDTCGLCNLYNDTGNYLVYKDCCKRCPIAKETTHGACEKFKQYQNYSNSGTSKDAKKVYDYLKRLKKKYVK
jgi:hypothetical protein